ncbi:lanthionine synthetase C family protein [Streptomyces albidoflavus]|uniref:lanthionine synthetase C family protein n=1 Tax=Streptomyces TaxID=1883 RepID=UPI002000039F|nr:lanthionine synthetase C family protein [Streptomyces sp. WAC00276]MCK2141657.1 lanthionine synthetase C family protein [Streptomyces sp. WAC00276]
MNSLTTSGEAAGGYAHKPKYTAEALRAAAEIASHLREISNLTPPKPEAPAVSLSCGYAGISLVHTAWAAQGDLAARRAAHTYLVAATQKLKTLENPRLGLHYDLCGLGFAISVAQQRTGGYDGALAALDARVVQMAHAFCLHADATTAGPMMHYDTLDGLAGILRYLLFRGLHKNSATERVLTSLISKVDLTEYKGHKVPRLWSTVPPNWKSNNSPEVMEFGHLNLGLAHGIAGPLAALALATSEGVVVPGQESAIVGIVELFDRFLQEDDHGPYWPTIVTASQWEEPRRPLPRGRASWCYGAPGISQAIQLAGQAMGEDSWVRTAQSSVEALLSLPMDQWGMDHWSICHGWAGNLQLLSKFATGPNQTRMMSLMDLVAERLIDPFREGMPAPFEVGVSGLTPGNQPASLLEGAAGAALVLRSYALPKEETPWEAAFLMA